MAKMCENCKWGVIGKYSQVYGGRPIGCSCPEEQLEKHCFVPKESKNETNKILQ